MKNLFYLILVVIFSMIIFTSCGKDNPVAPGLGSITATFKKNALNVPINIGSTKDTLRVDSIGTINNFRFRLDTIMNCNAVNVDIFLIHNGTVDTLLYRTTNSGTGFIGTGFSDFAATSIQNGSGTFSGDFKPYRPLSVFNGQNLNGQWIVQIISRTVDKSGVIKAWSVTITYSSTPPVSNEIWPLTVGNYWIYDLDTSGVVIGRDSMRITNTSTLYGKQVYWVEQSNTTVIGYCRNESDGFWDYGSSTQTYTPYLAYKYPINLNETFITPNDTITCTSTNTTFGGFTGCTEYRMKQSSTPSYLYFKPGIGLIGLSMDYLYFHIHQVLKSYHVQ